MQAAVSAHITGHRPARSVGQAKVLRTSNRAWIKASVRRRLCRARSSPEYKDLLATLQSLSDDELAAWGTQHHERLTLPFLGWLADEELSASEDPDRQQALWALGSKLMALREGLSPVGMEVLQAELRAAALRSCGGGGSADSDSGWDDDEEDTSASASSNGGKQKPGSQQNSVQQQQPAVPAALATPAFSSVVQQVAALGLSPEGMVLFEQQAAALEAVVGTSRARSLTEVIGRAKVQNEQQVQRLAEADAATRILDVLLSVHEREERAAMLPDAFTPPGSTAAVDDDAAYFSPDEDQLSTTPLRLLQAIDLYSARLQSGAGLGGLAGRQLAGGGLGMSLAQLQAALAELREDVEAYWSGGAGDTC